MVEFIKNNGGIRYESAGKSERIFGLLSIS